MLTRDTRQRPALPLAVMNALAPYATGCNQTATVLSKSSSEFYLPAVNLSEANQDEEKSPTEAGETGKNQKTTSHSSRAIDGLGRRILLVDDEPMIREYSRRILQ